LNEGTDESGAEATGSNGGTEKSGAEDTGLNGGTDESGVEDTSEPVANVERIITVNYIAEEGGHVSRSSEQVNFNAEDTSVYVVTATAQEGYEFAGWTMGDTVVTGEASVNPVNVITLTDDTVSVTLTAHFSKNTAAEPADPDAPVSPVEPADPDTPSEPVNPADIPVYVTIRGDVCTYDGAEHGAVVEVSELPKGYLLKSAVSPTRLRDVGSTEPSAQIVITDLNGNVVSNDNFTLIFTAINITVNPRALTVITSSASKTYDGKELTASGRVDGFAADEGDRVTFRTTGSQTAVGSSKNTYSITWNDVASSNYKITEKLGTLTVRASGSGEDTPEAPLDPGNEEGTPAPAAVIAGSSPEASETLKKESEVDTRGVLGVWRISDDRADNMDSAVKSMDSAAVLGADRNRDTGDHSSASVNITILMAAGVALSRLLASEKKYR
jgi:uncharacterized repeat protein (TIGR02543 family)